MQKSLFEIPQFNEAPKPPLQQCSVSRSTLYNGDCLIEIDETESEESQIKKEFHKWLDNNEDVGYEVL